MQIFATHKIPEEAAKYLWRISPNRARKMITETQQILARAQKHFKVFPHIKKSNGESFRTPLSRMNHPIVKWVCSDRKHVLWLNDYLYFLFSGYSGDKFVNVINNIDLIDAQFNSGISNVLWADEKIDFLNFAKCKSKNLDFTHVENVFEAYKKYLAIQINKKNLS